MRRRPDTEQDLLEGAVKEVLSVSEMKEFTLSEPSELQQGVRCKVQEQHVLGFDRTRGGQEEEARESMLATLQADQSRAEAQPRVAGRVAAPQAGTSGGSGQLQGHRRGTGLQL